MTATTDSIKQQKHRVENLVSICLQINSALYVPLQLPPQVFVAQSLQKTIFMLAELFYSHFS